MSSTPADETVPQSDGTVGRHAQFLDVDLSEALTLVRVTDTAWRIVDSRLSPTSEGHLLGFVEKKGDGVELMQLSSRFIWTEFDCMRAALDHVATTFRTVASERARSELAWIS